MIWAGSRYAQIAVTLLVQTAHRRLKVCWSKGEICVLAVAMKVWWEGVLMIEFPLLSVSEEPIIISEVRRCGKESELGFLRVCVQGD